MRRVAGGAIALMVLATVLIGATVAVDLAVPAPAGAAMTSTPLTVPSPKDLVVDPASGRIFVSGGDAIDVFAPDGTRTTTITGVAGAGGLDIAGGSLWVTSGMSLVEIDLVTLAVTRTVPTGFTLRSELLVIGTQAFTAAPHIYFPTSSDMGLAVDLLTGAAQGVPAYGTVSWYRARDASDRAVMIARLSGNAPMVRTIGVDPPHALLSEWRTQEFAAAEVSPDGRVLWGSTAARGIVELDLATGEPTGTIEAQARKADQAMVSTPAQGGLLVGLSSSHLTVNRIGVAQTFGTQSLPSDPVGKAAFSPDGSTLWRATSGALQGLTLVPSITAVTPSSVVGDGTTTVAISGSLLEGSTTLSLGGTPLPFSRVSDGSLRFTVPSTVPPGVHDVRLEHPLGSMSTNLEVTPATGALTGTVQIGTASAAGVTVRVSGGPLSAPLTTTTSSSGSFRFSGLVVARDYRLEIDQPSGARAGQILERVEVKSSGTAASISVVLRPVVIASGLSTTTKLPFTSTTPFGRLVTDPVSGRTFVVKGDELLAIDPDGDLIGRVRALGVPQGIATANGSVFVAGSATPTGTGTRITRVDASTFAVTGAWTNASRVVSDGIAFAGDRLFVLTEAGGGKVQTVDLGTGTVQELAGAPNGATGLAPVARAPNLLLVTTQSGLSLLDVSGSAPVTVVASSGPGQALAADGPSDRLWTADGRELQLSTLMPTGRDFGVGGAPSASPEHGGIVAFGPHIVSLSSGARSQTLGSNPKSALASTGDFAFAPSTTGDLSVFDLTPHVTGQTAAPTFVDGTFSVTGWGLGATTSATIDGEAVSFAVRSTTQVEVSTTAATGSHELRLTTPWGTTAPITFVASSRPGPSTVTSVAPSTVLVPGGPVTITGTDLTWATRIEVGGAFVSTFSVVDDTTIRFVAPPHRVGEAPIRVDNPLHQGVPGAALTYGYAGVVPTVTALAPASGLADAWTPITITGTGLDTATFVDFGGTPGVVVGVRSPTQIDVYAPPHPAGPVAVQVTTAGGVSEASPAATFTYLPPRPAVTAVSPATGYTIGGTTVTLTGSSFTGATSVRFGTVAASSFSVVDDRTIVAVSPPSSAAGTVNVIVTTPGGTDVARTTNRFAYTVAPTGEIRGAVRSADGPLAGMVVLVSPASSQSILTSVVTGADGSFSVPSLVAGSYRLNVFDGRSIFSLPSRFVGGWYVAGGTVTTSFAASTPVVVVAGGTVSIDTIVLGGPPPGSLSGVVTDGFAPIESMVVMVSPAARPELLSYAVSGPDGRFFIGGLAPGDYKVVILDGYLLFGRPPRYLTEYYGDVPDSATAFDEAPSIAVRSLEVRELGSIVVGSI